MITHDIIDTIGSKYLTRHTEKDEFSYTQALHTQIKDKLLKPINGHILLDLRFEKNNVSILIETKRKIKEKNEEQLFAYVELEKKYKPHNKIIAILASTENDDIKVWINGVLKEDEKKLKTFDEYLEYFNKSKTNNKEEVMQATYDLNILLHKDGIDESIRSQFVGTCLLGIKYKFKYKGLPTKQIISGLVEVLKNLLGNDKDIHRAEKLIIMNNDVLGKEDIKNLDPERFEYIINYIDRRIFPFIDEKSNQGQDLLNLFFTVFNKYVGKKDKNQAFTPDHIVHFMCKVAKVNKNSRVLDPTCGSGAFLVQSMIQALNKCQTKVEEDKVKREQIYGIEVSEKPFGLATTNMLIHGDGNSNVIKADCFKKQDWINDARINLVLMNPPYNAQKRYLPKTFTDTWPEDAKTDPSKGLYFVNYIADVVKNGKLLCLLPLACAIGNSGKTQEYKKYLLENNTLEAVFTLPNEIFYPGASVNACCMVFTLNQPHPDNHKTFFGYFKDDGFKKKKNLGRIDRGQWQEIEQHWLELFENKQELAGLSVLKSVSYMDEWLAEAYMETDYSKLTQQDFEQTINDYLSYLVKRGDK